MISLAIPTFNSSEFFAKSFEYVLHDPRITDIVICDDHSQDFASLAALVAEFNSPKIRLFRNDTNLKAFCNKNMAVSHCMNEWVILLDSDNSIDSTYIDAWLKEQPWDPKVLYCPDFAKPFFDYRFLSGERLARDEVALFFASTSPPLPDGIVGSLWDALFNGGNYAFSREEYMRTHKARTNIHSLVEESYGADVLHFIVLWIKRGLTLKIVPEMTYEHVIRGGSWSDIFLEQKYKAANTLLQILYDDSIVIA